MIGELINEFVKSPDIQEKLARCMRYNDQQLWEILLGGIFITGYERGFQGAMQKAAIEFDKALDGFNLSSPAKDAA